MAISAKKRASLPKKDFGVPGTDKYPLDTPGRARSALSRVKANGTPTEIKQVQDRVARKYPHIRVNKSK